MRKLGSLIAVALTALALTAPAAPAAQSAGWSCVANDMAPNWTLLASGGSPIPFMHVIPPEGPKVITAWKVTVGPGLGPIRQRLEAWAPQNEQYEFKKLGESALETLVEGVNSFPTRIPVSEGNSVGLYGPEGTLLCDEEGAISWRYEGSAASGEVKPFKTVVKVGTPIVVTVEDDRDNDGYGDESQDGCPVSAAIQTACPVLSLTMRRTAKPRAILVKVTTTNEATAQIFGQAGWQVKQPGGVKRRIVGLSAGSPRSVGAGTTSIFRLPLSKAIQRRLERLTPKQSLRANLTVSVTDVFGATIQQRLIVRLRGRG
jgi:hypothetical protein